jgi:hypothetical protein
MSGVVNFIHFINETVLRIEVSGAPSYILTPKQDNNHECDHKVQRL